MAKPQIDMRELSGKEWRKADAAGRAVLGVGGGITADSNPDAEWQECLDKAAATIEFQRQITFQRLRDKRTQLLFL